MKTTETNRPDMMTLSGAWVYFNNLENLDVRSVDIRIATENICRYNGFLNWHLLWHLALCVKLSQVHLQTGKVKDPTTPAYSGMHDFHEVYVGDMTSGMKKYCPEYTALEYEAEVRVHQYFGLPLGERDHVEVKFIDLRALVLEMWCLNHPAAQRCANAYGGDPTEDEICAFYEVQAMTSDEAWALVVGTVHAAKTRRDNFNISVF